MKRKVFFLAALVASVFSFTACDELGGLDLVGHINLTTGTPVAGLPGLTQPYEEGMALNFSSAMCNVSIDSVYVEAGDYTGTYEINAGTVFVGTRQDLLVDDIAELTFPLCGINLRDTVVGSYDISLPVDDFSFIDMLDTTNVNSLITSGLSIGDNLGNVFAVAVSEDAFYLGYSGTISISSYGQELHRVQGTVNNVQAVYITLEQIEYLASLTAEQRATFDLAAYLPKISFSGDFSTMRTNIDAIVEALNENAK